MKKLFLLLCLLFFSISYGQDTIISYLDSDKKKYVTKEKAAFTKILFQKSNYWMLITLKKLDSLISE